MCHLFKDINQPAQSTIRVRKQGKNDTSKAFRVRRQTIENPLLWLKNNNPAFSDIYISQDRLLTIAIDGEFQNIETLDYSNDDNLLKDNGPAPAQLIDTDVVTGETHSTMMLPDTVCHINKKVKIEYMYKCLHYVPRAHEVKNQRVIVKRTSKIMK